MPGTQEVPSPAGGGGVLGPELDLVCMVFGRAELRKKGIEAGEQCEQVGHGGRRWSKSGKEGGLVIRL